RRAGPARRSRRGGGRPMMSCPMEDLLARLLAGGLPDGERRGVEEHVESFPPCQAALAALPHHAPPPPPPPLPPPPPPPPPDLLPPLPHRPGPGHGAPGPGLPDRARLRDSRRTGPGRHGRGLQGPANPSPARRGVEGAPVGGPRRRRGVGPFQDRGGGGGPL